MAKNKPIKGKVVKKTTKVKPVIQPIQPTSRKLPSFINATTISIALVLIAAGIAAIFLLPGILGGEKDTHVDNLNELSGTDIGTQTELDSAVQNLTESIGELRGLLYEMQQMVA